jgi:competence protein ComEC
MILSGLGVALGRLYHPLGQVLAWLAWPFAAYTIRVVEFLGHIPGGAVTLGEFSLLAALFFYAVLLIITLSWSRFKEIAAPSAVAVILGVLAFLVWRTIFIMPDGRLHVTFLDVGSADGVLVTTPGGRHVLINGGASPSVLADQLGRRISPFDQSLETLVVASTQENQVAALPRTLRQYPPKSVLWAGRVAASFSAQQLKGWLSDTHIPLVLAEQDTDFDLGDGVTLHVLAVTSRGAVLGIQMGNFKALLPVGVNDDSFAALNNGNGLGPVNVLLLSESGYAPSNPPDWLANLKPQVTLLSVAADDPDGLPSPEVLAAFKDSNLLRTDRYGWIDLASNGEQVWITTQYK